MKVYLVIQGDYQCQGCANSYAEDVIAARSTEAKAQELLDELKAKDEARGIYHYCWRIWALDVL